MIHSQLPRGGESKQKVDCELIESYMLNGNYFEGGKGALGQPFIHYLLEELGSKTKLDRLVIYLARPNRSKGAVCL